MTPQRNMPGMDATTPPPSAASDAARMLAAMRKSHPATCAVCGKEYQTTAGSPSKSGLRFCSNRCRQTMQRQRRKNALR